MAIPKNVRKAVENALPDMQIVESPAAGDSDAVKPTVPPGPTLADLRRKYLGEDAGADDVKHADSDSGNSLADLRRKYLGEMSTSTDDADDKGESETSADDKAEGDEVEVLQVRSQNPADDPSDNEGPRTIIVSKVGNQVIGTQG